VLEIVFSVSKKLSSEDFQLTMLDPATLPDNVSVVVLFLHITSLLAVIDPEAETLVTLTFRVPSTVPTGTSPGISPYSIMLAK
jgi:hypothetical protein